MTDEEVTDVEMGSGSAEVDFDGDLDLDDDNFDEEGEMDAQFGQQGGIE